jgi:5-(carboxyamino)imidazole ribonucleotide synthase
VGFPQFLKTIRMGYDGKGQPRVANRVTYPRLGAIGRQPSIAEAMIHFEAEFLQF